MPDKIADTFEDLSHELHKDAEYRAEFGRQKPYYDLIHEIFNRRKIMGITQKELAEMAGMHQSTISRIESGEHDVQLSTIIQLAEALDARLDIRFVAVIDEDEFQKVLEVSGSTPLTIMQDYRDVSKEYPEIVTYIVST